jgi:DNA-binding transcriptional MerR regulator
METQMTLLAPRDVGRRLNLSTSRIIQLDREGVLPALRDSSGRRLYDPEVVEIFALEREGRRSAAMAPVECA